MQRFFTSNQKPGKVALQNISIAACKGPTTELVSANLQRRMEPSAELKSADVSFLA
jgi:hypothetical protein